MRRRRGFTLLEILVALVVLGFILVGLSQGVRFGLRATDTQMRLSEAPSDLDAVDRTLRRLIEQAEPGDSHTGPTFTGGPGRLAFISTLPQGASATAQLADIALGVEAHRLVLRWTPHLHAKRFAPAPAPLEVELLPAIEGVELAFWAGRWVGEWTSVGLPPLVRLRLIFPPGDRRHWPDIVVAPARQQAP